MRIKTEFVIELCTDPKSHRTALGSIKFDKEKALCIATDAKIMAQVPCEPDNDDESCLIPAEVWEQARKLAKASVPKSTYIFIRCKANEVTLVNGDKRPTCSARFPDWERVVSDAQIHIETGHITLSINPEYILDLAKSLGDKSKIELTIPLPEGNSKQVTKAIMARNTATWAEGSVGLIMPMM